MNTITALSQHLTATQAMLCTAESCTGGMVAAACTDVPGSSAWFWGGFVVYNNAAKIHLGIDPNILLEHGAVSDACVQALADAAQISSNAHVCVAISGIAGPDGGSVIKPVGTVYFGWTIGTQIHSEHQRFSGNRYQVRQQATHFAIAKTLALLLEH